MPVIITPFVAQRYRSKVDSVDTTLTADDVYLYTIRQRTVYTPAVIVSRPPMSTRQTARPLCRC